MICVETSVYGTTGLVSETIALLRERGYVAPGGSMIYTVFVDLERLRGNAPEGSTLTPGGEIIPDQGPKAQSSDTAAHFGAIECSCAP